MDIYIFKSLYQITQTAREYFAVIDSLPKHHWRTVRVCAIPVRNEQSLIGDDTEYMCIYGGQQITLMRNQIKKDRHGYYINVHCHYL